MEKDGAAVWIMALYAFCHGTERDQGAEAPGIDEGPDPQHPSTQFPLETESEVVLVENPYGFSFIFFPGMIDPGHQHNGILIRLRGFVRGTGILGIVRFVRTAEQPVAAKWRPGRR